MALSWVLISVSMLLIAVVVIAGAIEPTEKRPTTEKLTHYSHSKPQSFGLEGLMSGAHNRGSEIVGFNSCLVVCAG